MTIYDIKVKNINEDLKKLFDFFKSHKIRISNLSGNNAHDFYFAREGRLDYGNLAGRKEYTLDQAVKLFPPIQPLNFNYL